jgi:hypothetical protein
MPEPAARTSRSRTSARHLAAMVLLLVGGASLAVTAPAAANPDTGLARVTGGIKAGLGLAQHQGIDDPRLPYTVDSDWRLGPTVAAFLHFPVTDRFAVQQEIVYARKGSRQTIGVDILEIPTALDVVYDLDYLEIPLLLRLVWLRSARLDWYSLGGFSFALKINDNYRLSGQLVGEPDEEPVPLYADAPMDEVDIFDFAFVYGLGLEAPLGSRRLLLEYRFSLSLERLAMPTYAYVPTWDGELLIDNDPVPLRNQWHAIMLGIRF